MKSALDCLPCLLRQALAASRAVSNDTAVHDKVVREILAWMSVADMSQSPPAFAQHIHRQLRVVTGIDDPHRTAKERQNRIAIELLPELRRAMDRTPDRLAFAACAALAANVVDMGVRTDVNKSDLRQAVRLALKQPLAGDLNTFGLAAAAANHILYLTDNAGEIAFDRLLVEQLGPRRVTVAVRGAPVINDATLDDARAVGLDEIAEVIDNGSDAPGVVLGDCSEEFRRRWAASDLIIAKGQGNFESLSDSQRNIFFLFVVKCEVIANEVGAPVGTYIIAQWPRAIQGG